MRTADYSVSFKGMKVFRHRIVNLIYRKFCQILRLITSSIRLYKKECVVRESSRYLWAIFAVGFCLASREMRLYTAIYQYEGLTLEEMVISVVFSALIFGVSVPLLRKERKPALLMVVFAILTVLQTIAVMIQNSYVMGFITESLFQMRLPLEGCYSVGLVMIAVIVARVCGERSTEVFIGGFAFNGILQLVTALLKWEVAIGLISLFPCATFICVGVFIWISMRGAGCNNVLSSGNENDSTLPNSSTTGLGTGGQLLNWRLSHKETGAMLLSFFLMGALLISTHATRMGYQDGGSYSMAIQILSGLGGIAAAILLFILDRRFAGMTRLALVYLLVLPVLLVALYATSLFENIAVLVLLVFFHRFVYGLVYYFAWLLCLVPRGNSRLSDRFLTVFFVLKLGWAIGVLFFMILPARIPEGPWSVVLISFFFALGLVDVFLFIKMFRTAERGIEANGLHVVKVGLRNENSDSLLNYEEACRCVTEAYGLTKREAEVLTYLGKGRTAAYIREKMYISDGTARTHIDHIYKKLDVHSQQALIDVIDKISSQRN